MPLKLLVALELMADAIFEQLDGRSPDRIKADLHSFFPVFLESLD